MKQCKTCGQLKPLNEYANSKRNAGGKRPNCKACIRASVNKEAQNAAAKRYRDRYPERRLERDKAYRQQNQESIKVARNRYLKDKYEKDPAYRLQALLRQQIVDYIKYKKSDRTALILGYTADDFTARYGEGGPKDHIDHRIPKSWFKEKTPIDIIWHLDNLQWLSATENNIKYNKAMSPVTEEYWKLALPHLKDIYIHEFTKV